VRGDWQFIDSADNHHLNKYEQHTVFKNIKTLLNIYNKIIDHLKHVSYVTNSQDEESGLLLKFSMFSIFLTRGV
jgi:hypothetical protein